MPGTRGTTLFIITNNIRDFVTQGIRNTSTNLQTSIVCPPRKGKVFAEPEALSILTWRFNNTMKERDSALFNVPWKIRNHNTVEPFLSLHCLMDLDKGRFSKKEKPCGCIFEGNIIHHFTKIAIYRKTDRFF